MPGKAFLDSNIVVYGVSESDGLKREIARTLVDRPGTCVSTQVLSEFAAVLIRKLQFPPTEARARVAGLYHSCETQIVTPQVILDAFRVAEKYRYGFYDSQIIAAALAGGADVLYSEDMQHGQVIDGVLTIRSPFKTEAHQTRRRYGPAGRAASRAVKRSRR